MDFMKNRILLLALVSVTIQLALNIYCVASNKWVTGSTSYYQYEYDTISSGLFKRKCIVS